MNLDTLKKTIWDTTAKDIEFKSNELKEKLIRKNWLVIRQKLAATISLTESNISRIAEQVYPSMPLPFRLIVTEKDFLDYCIRNFSTTENAFPEELENPHDDNPDSEKLLDAELSSKCLEENND